MSTVVDSEGDFHRLPDELKSLIERKLRHRQREWERQRANAKGTAYSKLRENILASIQAGRLTAVFSTAPLTAYRAIVDDTVTVTGEWPAIVWETITSVLDKAPDVPVDRQDLNAIIDKYAWAISQQPFTLKYIDPEQVLALAVREAGRRGLAPKDSSTSPGRQWSLAAAAAKCEILNAARQAREGVSIAIDEYLIRQSDRRQGHGEDVRGNAPRVASFAPQQPDVDINLHCLPNPPKNVDDWFLVIKELATAFHRKNGRCPNVAEAWFSLRTSPPASYGIKAGHYRGEEAVFMDDRPLGKRAFGARWKRYSTTI